MQFHEKIFLIYMISRVFLPGLLNFSGTLRVGMAFYLDIMVTIVTKRFDVKYNGGNDKRHESNEMSPNVSSF